MANRGRFSAEVRERAVRLVREQEQAHGTQWAAIRSVAEKIGCSVETLRAWVRRAEGAAVPPPTLTTGERQRLQELERDNRELRRANEILRQAAAFFARAELDRPPR
jgi:transposase